MLLKPVINSESPVRAIAFRWCDYLQLAITFHEIFSIKEKGQHELWAFLYGNFINQHAVFHSYVSLLIGPKFIWLFYGLGMGPTACTVFCYVITVLLFVPFLYSQILLLFLFLVSLLLEAAKSNGICPTRLTPDPT